MRPSLIFGRRILNSQYRGKLYYSSASASEANTVTYQFKILGNGTVEREILTPALATTSPAKVWAAESFEDATARAGGGFVDVQPATKGESLGGFNPQE